MKQFADSSVDSIPDMGDALKAMLFIVKDQRSSIHNLKRQIEQLKTANKDLLAENSRLSNALK